MKSLFKSLQQILSVSAILLMLAMPVYSQESHVNLVLNAVSSNFNYGRENASMKQYKHNLAGFQAGFSVQAAITARFSIVPEFYFVKKGAILKLDNPITVNRSAVKLYAIELPLLARVHLGQLYINSGYYLGYNLAGRINVAASNDMPEKSGRISFGDAGDGFRRWDAGLQFGGGYNFKTRKSRLVLDLRYSYGLVNLSTDVERYNRSFKVSLFVLKHWQTKRS